MNPYVFNQYALAQKQFAAANLAQYNAANPVSASAASSTTTTTSNTTNANAAAASNLNGTADATAIAMNPYAAAMATNGALAQAAALNAYTRGIAAVQQQISNGMMALNQQQSINNALALNSNSADINGLNGMESVENEEEDNEDHGKHQKNKLVVEHDGFYNMKPLLAENILSSDYFKSLYRFKTYHEVIDETCRFCKNVEPLMVGLSRKPSTAFCILYKFFSMELTVRQVQGLLDYEDNAFVRCIGFLYLRYLLPAKDLWKWFSPYFDDDMEFSPGADGKVVSMKEFVCNLLQLQKYYSTLLPRIPVKIERAYKKRLLQRELIKKRDADNECFRDQLTEGMEVRAQWQDLKWYPAVIDECMESGQFLVTFTEYEDQCEVSIGQIQLKKKKKAMGTDRGRERSHDRSSRDRERRDRDRDRDRSRRDRHDGRRRKRKRSMSRDRSRSRSRNSRSISVSYSRSRSPSSRSRSRSKSRSPSSRRHRSSRHKSRSSRHHSSSRHRSGRHRSSRHKRSRYEEDRRRGSASRGEGDGGYSDDEMNDEAALEQMLKKKEMEACVAIGRDYARRPTAYYHSLTLHLETGTNRKRSPSPAPVSSRKKSKISSSAASKRAVAPPPKVVSKEHLEKMRQLRLKYGDASKKK